MYKILYSGLLICSSLIEETAVIDPVVTLEANKAGSMVFTLPPGHPHYDDIAMRAGLVDVYWNNELIFEGVATQIKTDFKKQKKISCEGEMTFLNDSVQPPAAYTNQTVGQLLAAYLNAHNSQMDANRQYTLGAVTVSGSGLTRHTNYLTTMDEIAEDLVKDFGGYLRVRHDQGVRYLDYLVGSPHTSTQIIKIGQNLIDLAQDLSSKDICTVLIPLGARTGSQTVEGIDDRVTVKSVNSGNDFIVGTAANTFGNVWRTVTFDNISDPSALLAAGEAYLADTQWANLVISASAYDLGLSDADVEQFRLLDSIRVVSAPHGLDRYMTLTKLKINLNHPGQTVIQLGTNETLSLTAQTAALAGDVESAAVINSVDITERARANARAILESATGGCVYFHYDSNGVLDEIRIMDNADPAQATKIWRWNIGGLGYTSNGGQSYSVAMTMDGSIVADFITSGQMDAARIRVSDLVAFGATIGGFTIDSDSIRAGAKDAVTPGAITISTGDFSRLINAVLRTGLRLAIGGNFAVDKDGTLYTSGAVIHGSIESSAGSISDPDQIRSVYKNNGVTYSGSLTPTGLEISDGTNTFRISMVGAGANVGPISIYNGEVGNLPTAFGDLGYTGDTVLENAIVTVPVSASPTEICRTSRIGGLAPGHWLVTGYVKFPADAGTRQIFLATDTGTLPANESGQDICAGSSDSATLHFVTTLELQTAGVYRLMAMHTGNSAQTVSGELRAVRFS